MLGWVRLGAGGGGVGLWGLWQVRSAVCWVRLD